MPWQGIAIAAATLAVVCVVLMRALRKARDYESWGVGEMSQRYGGPLPGQLGPPIEVVSEPEEDEAGVASTGGAARREAE